MTSKVPTPVSGSDSHQDGRDAVKEPGGRGSGGESGGGNYGSLRDETGRDQPNLGYHGGEHAGSETKDSPNNMVRDGGDWAATGDTGPKPGPTGPDQDMDAEYPRDVTIGNQHIEIIDTSGIAAAEAAGLEGPKGDTEHPGSG